MIRTSARPFCRSKGSRSLLLQTANYLISQPLSRSPDYAWYWVAPVWGQGIPLPHTDIAAVGTTFIVFSYDGIWAEHPTHHLSNAEQIGYVLRHGRGLSGCLPFYYLQILCPFLVYWVSCHYFLVHVHNFPISSLNRM